jgi:hypothetical protein
MSSLTISRIQTTTKPGVTWQVRTVKMTRENEAFDKAFPVILARDKVIEAAKLVRVLRLSFAATFDDIERAYVNMDFQVDALLAAEKDRT